MNNKTGMLITFEGPEGSGKSTQIQKLTNALRDRGLDIVQLREPGGTKISDQFRVIPHDLANDKLSTWAEAWAYQGARAQLYEEVITPSLNQGKIILCDRSIDSTIAYQGFARGLGCVRLDEINKISTQSVIPDLTIFFDLPVEQGLHRRQVGEGEWNRLDAEALEFHQNVRYAYLTMHNHDKVDGRWRYVDASRGIDEVYADVRRIVESELTSRGFIESICSSKERR